MSDQLSRRDGANTDTDPYTDTGTAPATAPPATVEVRRRLPVTAAVAAATAVVAVAWLVRALGSGSLVDWGVAVLVGGLSGLHLLATVDGRTPLLVADAQGVRLRTGRTWHGLAWHDLDCVEHLPRRGVLRDGHVLAVDAAGEQTMVALTLTTRIVGADDGTVADALAALADGRCDVVEVAPEGPADAEPAALVGDVHEPEAGPDHDAEVAEVAEVAEPTAGPVEEPASEAEVHEEEPVDEPTDADETAATPVPATRPWAEPATDLQPSAPPSPVRAPVVAARSETLASRIFSSVVGANALRRDHAADEQPEPLPETEALRRPAQPGDGDGMWTLAEGVRTTGPSSEGPVGATGTAGTAGAVGPATTPGSFDPLTDPLPEPVREPARDPVIGPVLAGARERLGLSVDQLADRTRIRAHVIEAVEVDDFGPCGGDFYARGHLRTLARVLGVDVAPLLATYDEEYADAPVDPRRVFEADLAAGSGGALRSTRGGPNWTVLVAAVMGVVLVWSVARLLMDGPPAEPTTPVLNQSGGLHRNDARGQEVPITFTAAGGGATVQVRDASGEVVFDGELAFGQTADVSAVPPLKVSASDGSVTVSVDGAPASALGTTGEEAQKTLVAP